MLALFAMLAEFSDVLYYRQSLAFVRDTLDYLLRMDVFEQAKRSPIHLPLAEDAGKFLRSVKMRVPFLLKRAVVYGTCFPELGEILLHFHGLMRSKPGIFYECLQPADFFRGYIASLLRGEGEEGDRRVGQVVAIKLVNKLVSSDNFFQQFYL
jgi:hypothetical protein